MQTYFYPHLPPAAALAAATGMFDGIHRGHQEVLALLLATARQCGLPSAVLTYEPHPREVLCKNDSPKLLTTFAEKQALLAASGIDFLIVIPFTAEFAGLKAAEFLRLYIMSKLRVEHMIVGCNQRIGSDGVSDFNVLKEICKPLQIVAEQAPQMAEDGAAISSTRIRRALSAGSIAQANEMLGRAYSISGVVAVGMRLGRILGFPTANINVDDKKLLPRDGVYAVRARLAGRIYGAMMHIGAKPTISRQAAASHPSAEVHLFDFDMEIYGERMEIEIIEWLRCEQKFGSLDELKAALKIDMQSAKTILLH